MSQTRLPDWYPDPNDPSRMRWWDGLAWTETTRFTSAGEAPSTGDAPSVLPDPAHPAHLAHPTHPENDEIWHRAHPLIAGLLFLIAGVLAGTQVVYMTTVYSALSFRGSVGVPISLPFDWYLVLFPYWLWRGAFFTWGLIPPVILLLACSASTLVFRRRPRTTMVVVAGCLTLENLLLFVPIFINSGMPGPYIRIIFDPSQFSTSTLVGVLILHVVVWALPLLYACAAIGGRTGRRRMSIVFLVACVAYVLWYLGSFLFGTFGAYLLTPGPARYVGSWIAPASTLLCLAAMTVYVLPSVRRR